MEKTLITLAKRGFIGGRLIVAVMALLVAILHVFLWWEIIKNPQLRPIAIAVEVGSIIVHLLQKKYGIED